MNRPSVRPWRRGIGPLLAGATLLGCLGGCVDAGSGPTASVAKPDIRNAIARGQLTSPRAATVALASLEGAPDGVQARLRQSLSTEAASREITITDEVSARYLVRGYLSAYPGEKGITVAYVYDVFDSGRKLRDLRVEDTTDVPGSADDPWSAVTEPVIANLAARSADDLAVALAGTPEAQAAGKVAAVTPATVAPPAAGPN
jgi:hypothetical protein